MALKLNSLDRTLFEASDRRDSRIRVNSAGEISRNEIIATGRLLYSEYVGRRLNALPVRANSEKYVSMLRERGVDYQTLSQKHQEKLELFCAAQAYRAIGKDPADLETVRRDNSLNKSPVFLATMAAIIQEIVNPLVPAVAYDLTAGGRIQWYTAPAGGTVAVDVRSNDVFLWQDSAPGSSNSTPKNYMYAKTVTLSPKTYTCNFTIKGYQDWVNGDAGYHYASLGFGLMNKCYAMMIQDLKAGTEDGMILSALTATSYSSENWNNITTLVAAANGVTRGDLVAYGGIGALSKVLPTDGEAAAITGLQYGLGEEWFRRGYLPNAAGVQLLEITPVIVPGTQNTTLDTIDFGDNIYIAAKGGYAPIFGVFAEGTPFTISMSPAETADRTINVNMTAMFDMMPVFASKLGVIETA